MGSFSESYGTKGLNLTPKDGQELIQVKAQVENTSSESDPAYVSWVLSPSLKGLFEMDDADWVKMTEPRRLASSKFLYLKTNLGNFPCQFVYKDCKALIGGDSLRATLVFIRLGDTKVTEYPGTYVKKESKFDLEVVFSVPKGVKDLQLIVLGSPAVEIK